MMNKIDILQVPCSSPIVIPNPGLRYLILYCDIVSIHGHTSFISPEERSAIVERNSIYRVFNIPFQFIPSIDDLFKQYDSYVDSENFDNSPLMSFDKYVEYVYNNKSDYLNSFYICDSTSGECFPLFSVVKCGKCEHCSSLHVMSLNQQAKFQLLQSNGKNIFVTLTYNDSHLPKDGVNKKHVQLFKKRFKVLISRKISIDAGKNIKFLFASEYGSKNGRPHYHGLVYGIPKEIPDDVIYHMLMYCWREPVRLLSGRFYSFSSYCIDYPQIFKRPEHYDSFSYGFVNLVFVSNTSACSYITKYSFKSCDNAPADKNPNFILRSNYLGVEFVTKYKQSLLDSHDGKLTYFDFTKDVVKSVRLCSYYIDKLFPSMSKLIPSEFRRNFIDLVYYSQLIASSNDFDATLKSSALNTMIFVSEKYSEFAYHYLKTSTSSLRCPLFDKSFIINEYLQCAEYLINYKEIDFKTIIEQAYFRDYLFSKYKCDLPFFQRKKSSFYKQNIINQSKSKL